MTKATVDEALLLLRLAEWQTCCELPAALSWLWSTDFLPEYTAFARQCPPDSEKDRTVALICAYFDAVGVLYEHGLLTGELIFDWLAVAAVWDRLKGYVLGRRHDGGGRSLWANFEALAVAHKRMLGEYST